MRPNFSYMLFRKIMSGIFQLSSVQFWKLKQSCHQPKKHCLERYILVDLISYLFLINSFDKFIYLCIYLIVYLFIHVFLFNSLLCLFSIDIFIICLLIAFIYYLNIYCLFIYFITYSLNFSFLFNLFIYFVCLFCLHCFIN